MMEKRNTIVVELLDLAYLESRLWTFCSANAAVAPVATADFPLATQSVCLIIAKFEVVIRKTSNAVTPWHRLVYSWFRIILGRVMNRAFSQSNIVTICS